MEFTGSVVRKTFAARSKSEHAAVVLSTGSAEYRLERAEGNPFHDPELEKLVGKRIVATGEVIAGHTVRMQSFRVID